MKISLVLPSLFAELIDGALEAAHEAAEGIEHEIVVVSPYEVSRPGVRWIREAEPRGSIAACNLGFAHATGDVIALIADDNRLTKGALRLALAHLTQREARCPTLLLGFPRQRAHLTFVGTVCGHYYPYFFVTRPTTLERAGGPFHEGFRKHFADPDLGMRVWAAGGRCEVVAGATIVDVDSRNGAGIAPDIGLGSLQRDFELFHGRWGAHFPAWGNSTEGLNLDVAIDFLPLIGQTDTVAIPDGPRVLDLRILSKLTILSLHHGHPVSIGRANTALEYLRWLAGIAPDVLNIVVKNSDLATLARP
ncbi:MAG: glycosyltransferase [Rhodospirillales bacterium]|nr:glycosyltransferase [Rhodospirillales bacterium]